MQFVWGQKLGHPECPYIQRWVFKFGVFSFRLHRWFHSDDDRYFHDHPWWYISFLICGSYNDVSPLGTRVRKPGSLAFYRANHQHTVQITKSPCWTILLTGSEKREWGFWVRGRFRKRNRYFYDHGHPPCEK